MIFLDWHLHFFPILVLLIFGHCLGDFAFQSEYMALGKDASNSKNLHPGLLLSVHSCIHAGLVYIITGSLWLGLFEFVCHWVIDNMKCFKHISYGTDQLLHVICKIVWALLICTWIYSSPGAPAFRVGFYA